jgi:Sulfotransferase family
VVGAYKAGTTTLHHVLRAHPEVFVPERREPNFFAFADRPDPANPAWQRSVRDEAAYRALFAAAGAAAAVGEVSPEYLLHPSAATSIAERIPDVTLVAVLRNPADRAFSDWVMYRREGTEKLDFTAALDVQDERRQRGEPTGYYVSAGEYADQVQRYIDVFGRDRLQVWLYDDVTADPDRAYAEIFSAIGVDPAVPLQTGEHHNLGAVPVGSRDRIAYAARTRLRPLTSRLPLGGARRRLSAKLDERLVRPTLEPETRARLVAHFRADVERLQDLIGRDLSAWLRVETT